MRPLKCGAAEKMGGFDLYGNYYPSINDAMNAELSQCNEIDNRFNREKITELEQKQINKDEEIHHLKQKISELEQRLSVIENQKP